MQGHVAICPCTLRLRIQSLLCFINPKLPGTIKIIGMGIGRTGNTAGLDSGIDGFSKRAVFNHSHWLARKICQPLSFSGGLYTAVRHVKPQTISNPFASLFVEHGVETKIQRLLKSFQTPFFWKVEKRFNPICLDRRKTLPGLNIQRDCILLTIYVFHSLKPKTIMGQPVFCKIGKQCQQLSS